MPVIGEEPDSELGKLGFLYGSNPMQHAVSGGAILGTVKWGGANFGSAAFGSQRTSDPDPRAGSLDILAAPGFPSGEQGQAYSLEQTGGLGSHAAK